MFYLLEFNLEKGISLVTAGRREAVWHPPIVLLSNHHQKKEKFV
jgi:hypothetical protein